MKEEDGPGPKGSRQNFFRFLDIRLIYKLGNRTDKAGQEMPSYSAKYQAFLSMEVLPPFQAPTQNRLTSPGPSTHSRSQRALSGVWAMPSASEEQAGLLRLLLINSTASSGAKEPPPSEETKGT